MVKIIIPIENKYTREELELLDELKIELLAKATGYYKREPKKITATNMFKSFLLMKRLDKNTLREWASLIGSLTKETVSTEALNERLNDAAVALFQRVLKDSLELKLDKDEIQKSKENRKDLIKYFNRILMRDSTLQQINSALSKYYRGSFSSAEPTALIRIQALYDFISESWVNFGFKTYSENDQSAAFDIADSMEKKDLLLQDLGYFVLDWLEQLTKHQYIITKWDNKTYIYEMDGTQIDLLKLLKKEGKVDMQVLVGKEKRIPMRLVAQKLKPKIARKHIEEARNHRHSKSNHSDRYYKLLNYEIYLTNVESEVLDIKDICKLYGLRWHIEILFKSWKSFDNFKVFLRERKMKVERLKFSVYAILIKVVWAQNILYQYIKDRGKFPRPISDMKFISTVNIHLDDILKIKHLDELDELLPQFRQHALYDQHRKRRNTKDKHNKIRELCITYK